MKVENKGPKIVFCLSWTCTLPPKKKKEGECLLTFSIAHVKAFKQGSQDSQNKKERYANPYPTGFIPLNSS